MTRLHRTQIIRIITQIAFLILMPGLFTLVFSELKQVFTALIKGNIAILQVQDLFELIAVVLITVFLGRVFCSWACAFGTFNELISIISRKLFKVKFRVNDKLDKVLNYTKYAVLILIIVFIWTLGIKVPEPISPWDAFGQLTNISEAFPFYITGFILLGLIALGSVFIERLFCRYLCPLGAILSLISRFRLLRIIKPRENCGKCSVCTTECSMGLNLNKVDLITSGDCINCMNCTEVCPKNNAHVAIINRKLKPEIAGIVAASSFAGLYSISTIGLSYSDNQYDAQVNSALQAAPYSTAPNTGSPKATYPPVRTAPGNTTAPRNSTPATAPATTPASTPVPTQVPKKYKDGTYTGIGAGYRKGLQVSVTIKDGLITKVQVVSSNETARYVQKAFKVIPEQIVQRQSLKFDIITGATLTSYGMLEAVNDALIKAKF